MVSRLPDNMVIDLTNDSDSEDQIQSQVGYHFLLFSFNFSILFYRLDSVVGWV